MKKLLCCIVIFLCSLLCLNFISCSNSTSPNAIYTTNYGTIRPIKVYTTENGIMEALDGSKRTAKIGIKYKYYCRTNEYYAYYPHNPECYNCDSRIWSSTKNGKYYSKYWGDEIMVSYSADLSYYKTLPVELIEKEDTYKITYYDLDKRCLNDLSKNTLSRYKKVIEINKTAVKKIEY